MHSQVERLILWIIRLSDWAAQAQPNLRCGASEGTAGARKRLVLEIYNFLRETNLAFVGDITLSNGQIPPDAKASGGPNPLPCAPYDCDNIAKVADAISVRIIHGRLVQL